MVGSSKTETLTLDARELVRALAVLDREQELFLPTPRELRQARLLLALTIIFVFLAAVAGFDIAWWGSLAVVVVLPYPLNAILLLMATLLYLDLGLLRKLWNLESLRRRHHLAEVLSTRFRAEWRRRWGANVVKLLLALLGAGLVALPLAFWNDLAGIALEIARELSVTAKLLIAGLALLAAVTGYLWKRWRPVPGERYRRRHGLALSLLCVGWTPLAVALGAWMLVPVFNWTFTFFPGTPILGASLVSLYLIGQGKQRLEAVDSLHRQLAGAPTQESGDGSGATEIPADVYQAIAGLERNQIFVARQQSIRAGAAEGRDSSCLIQKSHPAREALEALEPAARAAVEEAIFRLTLDATPEDARLDEESGRHRLAVSGTGAEIIYAVEPDACRIRIFAIDQPAPRTGG